MRQMTIMPYAVMAIALVSFLLLVDIAINPPPKPSSVAPLTGSGKLCTRDAKICPDGSSVGRVAPSCDFAPCPGTNANGNTNSNTNTGASINVNQGLDMQQLYSVADAVKSASDLDGQSVCIIGDAQQSFEFNAFGQSSKQVQAQSVLQEPYIWVEFALPFKDSDCTSDDRGKICQATLSACGVFHYAPPGHQGFGSTGAYRYDLSEGPSQVPATQ